MAGKYVDIRVRKFYKGDELVIRFPDYDYSIPLIVDIRSVDNMFYGNYHEYSIAIEKGISLVIAPEHELFNLIDGWYEEQVKADA